MVTLNSNALTTLADVKETLGISSAVTTKDNLIIRKINQASQLIENYCQRSFKSAPYIEYYDGSGTQELMLRQRPVTVLTSVEARNTSLNDNDFSSVPTDQYFLDTNAGIINALSWFWGRYSRWRVTYTAGYATIPSDLAEAAATLAAYLTTHTTPGLIEQQVKEGQREVRYQQKPVITNIYDLIGIRDTLDAYADTVLSGNR